MAEQESLIDRHLTKGCIYNNAENSADRSEV